MWATCKSSLRAWRCCCGGTGFNRFQPVPGGEAGAFEWPQKGTKRHKKADWGDERQMELPRLSRVKAE
ncbi:MAG: hypothetical protein SynsKO_02960 [Synoicihabitans sp.]